MELRQETPDDWWAVETLFDLTFAPGRTALSSYRLRDGVDPVADLCLVAAEGDVIGGAIRFWPVQIAGAPALLLGPVAVHPTRQGEGLGGLLIRRGIERAQASNRCRILLVGDAPYYQKFGFSRLDGIQMPPPTNPDRVLGLGDWAKVAGVVERA